MYVNPLSQYLAHNKYSIILAIIIPHSFNKNLLSLFHVSGPTAGSSDKDSVLPWNLDSIALDTDDKQVNTLIILIISDNDKCLRSK